MRCSPSPAPRERVPSADQRSCLQATHPRRGGGQLRSARSTGSQEEVNPALTGMTYERPFATEAELWDVGRMAELVSALPNRDELPGVADLGEIFDKIESSVRQIAAVLPGGVRDVNE